MARDRSRGRKNHIHQSGVRCSRCRPLSKDEVARIAPPPPARPAEELTQTQIQRIAYNIRANAVARAAMRRAKNTPEDATNIPRSPTPRSGERGQRRVQAK